MNIAWLITKFVVVGAMCWGAYFLGKSNGSEACVKATQEHDDKIRKEEQVKAEFRIASLGRTIARINGMYISQRDTAIELASKLDAAIQETQKTQKVFEERIRDVQDNASCRVPADVLRMLNDGIADPPGTNNTGRTGKAPVRPAPRTN